MTTPLHSFEEDGVSLFPEIDYTTGMEQEADISFRPAAATDIRLVQDLSSRIWREHFPGIITHGKIDHMHPRIISAEVISNEIRNRDYRYELVLHDGEAVGFIACRFDAGTLTVLVSKLYLLPSVHEKGIGRRMLQHVKENAVWLGAERITLFVNKRNNNAIKTYERFGFTKAKAVVTDIGGRFVMDDYRMELLL